MIALLLSLAAMVGTGAPLTTSKASPQACAAALAALEAARENIHDVDFNVISEDGGNVRYAIDRSHFRDVGDGDWGKSAPSGETAEAYLNAHNVAAFQVCGEVRTRFEELHFKVGKKFIRRAELLNRHAKRDTTRFGVVLSIELPILNRAETEALVSVDFGYSGMRAGSGWVYLLRRQSGGSWRLVDRQFVYVV